MHKLMTATLFLHLLFSSNVFAKENILHRQINAAVASDEFKSEQIGEVRFFFGDQQYPVPQDMRGEFRSSEKINILSNSEEAACDTVFLSALVSLQKKALAQGGNAIVDIVSTYKDKELSSSTAYQCNVGRILAGVALKGRVVTLP